MNLLQKEVGYGTAVTESLSSPCTSTTAGKPTSAGQPNLTDSSRQARCLPRRLSSLASMSVTSGTSQLTAGLIHCQ